MKRPSPPPPASKPSAISLDSVRCRYNHPFFTDSVKIVAFFTNPAILAGSSFYGEYAMKSGNTGLALADGLVADGKSLFTLADACRRLGKSRAATGNLLRRMQDAGLVDRVRQGRYVVRQLGVLGTPSAAEGTALAVAAALSGTPHRMAYRTALDEHGLLTHPARSIQVASSQRIRARALSGRALKVIHESPRTLDLCAVDWGGSRVSDLERSLLEAAKRPNLVGGVAVLAEAMAAAGRRADIDKLMGHAELLGWAAPLRRLGSIADTLQIPGLARQLRPLRQPSADLNLDPAAPACDWRDPRWRVRWPIPAAELRAVTGQ